MKNIIIIPDQFQIKVKQQKIHLLLKQNRQTKNKLGGIKIIQQSQTHKIHFFGSHEIFNINKDFKTNIKNGFLNFNHDVEFKIKGFNFGYFLEQQFTPIHSMHDVDPLGQGNIIKHEQQRKYLIVNGDQLSLSSFLISNQLLFYRVIQGNLRFYQGLLNYDNFVEVYITIDQNKVRITRNKNQQKIWRYKVFTFNQIYMSCSQNNLYYDQQFYVGPSGDYFNYELYQHNINELQYDFFGLDDRTFSVFKINSGQVIYQNSDNLLQIQTGPYNEAKFYINRIQHYLKLVGSKIYLVQQAENLFYIQQYQNNLFSLYHQNKYLKYDGEIWTLTNQLFKFKNKPYGLYIFHTTGIQRCLSSYDLKKMEDRYVDKEYALYYSVQNSKFYLNKNQIFVNQQFQLTYNSGFPLEVFQTQQFGFNIGFYSQENKIFLRLIQNSVFTFTNLLYQATLFYYSNIQYWSFNALNSFKIQFKKMKLTNNQLELAQTDQRFVIQWLLIENQFLILSSCQLLFKLFPLTFSQKKAFSEIKQDPFSIRLKNIKQIYSNYFSANMVAHENNFYNQLNRQITIGQQGNYISASNQTIEVFFHKIPHPIALPMSISTIQMQITNNVLSKNYEYNKGITFSRIGNNLYFVKDHDFILTLLESNPLNPLRIMKYSNTFNGNITFSLLQLTDKRFRIVCKLWGNMGCEGIINDYDINKIPLTLGYQPYDFNRNMLEI